MDAAKSEDWERACPLGLELLGCSKEFSPLVNCSYSKLAGSLNRTRRRPLGGKIIRGLASYLLGRRNECIPTHAVCVPATQVI